MKFLITVCFLFFSIATQAGAVKEIYTRTIEEIEFYFEVDGDWAVDTVSDVKFVRSANPSEILVNAQANIRNAHDGRRSRKDCLVAFEKDTFDTLHVTCN